ncbi:MAG: hypothetical protein LBQ78_08380 [Tannerellaceae bacterium]|nr:hypothetical protein [Tannerellaceae bacterium]
MTVQQSFAQTTGEVTVYLRNGSVVIGELTEVSDERLYVETPNGSIVYFTDKAIKEIVEEGPSKPKRIFRDEVTVYLRNGSVLIGQLTEAGADGRMKLETPNRSVIYFTEKSIKEVGKAGARGARSAATGRSSADNAGSSRSAASRSQAARSQGQSQAPRSAGTRPATQQREAIPQYMPEPDYKVSGYTGFLEGGYTLGIGDISTSRIAFSTSHGIQVNPYFFIGVGLGANLYSDGLYYRGNIAKDTIMVNGTVEKDTLNTPITIPVFVDLRFNFIEGASIIPFAGLKAGYTIGISKRDYKDSQKTRQETKMEGVGFYVEPSVGVKFMLSSSFALNLSAGYSFQTFTHPYKLENIQYRKIKNNGGPCFKIGIEF